jgi:serine/threonine protein kinase
MPADVRTRTVLAGFRIESQIGEGAMGTVYLAGDTRRGGRVALKVLSRDLAGPVWTGDAKEGGWCEPWGPGDDLLVVGERRHADAHAVGKG